MKVTAVDLFCGAGGTSTGLATACRESGFELDLIAINHWEAAINTHSRNHPHAEHRCEPIELLKPGEVMGGRHLNILMASPECTHHSNARGGKPINDQSRSTAFRVLEWTEALRPDYVLIENVTEFQTWGPLGGDGRPDKKRKGEIYSQWIQMFVALGYRVEYRILNAADYGDPTTRKRLFIIARRGDNPHRWPDPTHCDPKKMKGALMQELEPWRTAREIIDWDHKGQSIFNRKKPLAAKTLQRIEAGLRKFGGPNAEPFLVILRQHMAGQTIDGPLPTLCASGGHIALASPCLIKYHGGESPYQWERSESVEKPILTADCSNRFAVVDPMLIRYTKGDASMMASPMPTQTTKDRFAVVEPMILPHRMYDMDSCDSIEEPMRTITATNGRLNGVVEPVIVPFFGERDGQESRSHSVHESLPTVTSHGAGALVDPIIVPIGQKGGDSSSESPLGTLTTTERRAVVEPMIVNLCHGNGNEDPEQAAQRRVKSIDEPLGTLTTGHGQAIATPFIVAAGGPVGSAHPRSVDEPMNTVLCENHKYLATPFILTTEEGQFGLDIRLRMLQPRELARAMGFPDDYEFLGTKDAQVRQIGNAVAVHVATALCRSILSQLDIQKSEPVRLEVAV